MPPIITATFKKTHKASRALLAYTNSFKVIVIMPLVVISLYLCVFASDRYVSESRVTVKQSGSSPDIGSLFASLGGGAGSKEPNLHLQKYILSLDMLNYLDENIDLRAAYQQHGDFFSRLTETASQEDFYKYYLTRIEVLIDSESGTLVIRTQAFDPDFALRMNTVIMKQSEKFINESSHKIADEQLKFISIELARVSVELSATKDKLLAFQNRHKILDPVAQAKAMSRFVLDLEAQQSRQEAELRNLQTFLAEDSFQFTTFRNKLDALNRQVLEEKQKISGEEGNKLNALSSQFMTLKFQTNFATDKYQAALSAYEKTRVEVLRKIKNLVVISSPHKQEQAEYPRRMHIIVTALFGFLILYGIIRLLIATIEDHKD